MGDARVLDRTRVARLAWIVVILAMLWSLGLVVAAATWGGEGARESLGSIGPRLALATLAAFVVNHALRFVRWHLMLRTEGRAPPWPRSLSIFLAGLALLPTPGKAGVAARTVLLADEGVAADVSLAAYFAERLLDLVGLLMFASVLVGRELPAYRWVVALAIGAVCIVAILVAPRACRAMRPRVARRERVARAVDWLAKFFTDAEDMLSGWRLPVFLLIGIAANAATGLLLWFALVFSPHAIDFARALGVLAVSHLSGSISMLPGGLGGFEVVMLAQLSSAGVDAVDALAALTVVRIVTLWASVAVGLPLLWLGMRRGYGRAAARGE